MTIHDFLRECAETAYVEQPSQLHTDITHAVWERVKPQIQLDKEAEILDIGSGSGLALDMFKSDGYENLMGLVCLNSEAAALYERGYEVINCDMHRFGEEYYSAHFNLIWCRHALEHSPIPLYMLKEFHRTLMDGGYLYLEVPGADCDSDSQHASNPNHFSITTQYSWVSLITKAGFSISNSFTVDFSTALGKDRYYGFLCQKL